MVAMIDGERIIDVKMVVGYLHRSMEKLAEERTYTQNIPFTDRMDYLAAMTSNLGYCLSVEKLAGIEVPERAQYLRVIFAELQRIASHCMATGAFINDCGAWQTPLMYMFREREKILDLFEMTCGARLTTELHAHRRRRLRRPGRVVPGARRADRRDAGPHSPNTTSCSWTTRSSCRARATSASLTPEVAINASLSGPMLRGAGIAWDIRKADPYCVYDRYDFDIPVGYNGDCYDRFMVSASKRCGRACASSGRRWPSCPAGPSQDRGAAGHPAAGRRGLRPHRVAEGRARLLRGQRRRPGAVPLARPRALATSTSACCKEMTVGQTIADAIVTLGSIDINVGEVDR